MGAPVRKQPGRAAAQADRRGNDRLLVRRSGEDPVAVATRPIRPGQNIAQMERGCLASLARIADEEVGDDVKLLQALRTAAWRATQRVSGRHCSQSCSPRERGKSNTDSPSRAQ